MLVLDRYKKLVISCNCKHVILISFNILFYRFFKRNKTTQAEVHNQSEVERVEPVVSHGVQNQLTEASGSSSSSLPQESSTLPVDSAENQITLIDTECDAGSLTNENDDITVLEEKKKEKYQQKFRTAWLKQFKWLNNKNGVPVCARCNINLVCNFHHFLRHEKTARHKRMSNFVTTNLKITDFNRQIIDHRKSVELKLVMFLHEHNLPFQLMDHLPKLIKSASPDSQIASDINCQRPLQLPNMI